MQVDLKKLKPIGIVLILGFSVLALIMCLTANMGVPERYQPQHDADYYRQNADTLQELIDELEMYEFPNFEGEEKCSIDSETMTVRIEADASQVSRLTAVLERDFGEGLFTVTAGS